MKKTILVLGLLVFSACAKQAPHPSDTGPQYYTHTIASQGETLASIARWYTGASANWQTILSHNPGLDVRRMRVGTQIQIPQNMLVRTAAMPRTKSSQTTQAAKGSDEELLAPAERSLAESQPPAADGQASLGNAEISDDSSDEPAQAAVESQPAEQTNPESDPAGAVAGTTDSQADQVEAPAELAAEAQAGSETAPGTQNKSFLSKWQDAAMKAQENSLNKGESPQVPAENAPATAAEIQADAVNKANQQAQAAQEEANAKIKAAQEQAAQAQKDADAAQQNSNKTREDLIKELTQDY